MTPTKEKCIDPVTGKLCPGFWPGFYGPSNNNPLGICLIRDNLDQVKPPKWCQMLKNQKSCEAIENGSE